MPTILRWRGRRFYFYSSDEDEPPHVHVDHRRAHMVWLDTLKVAYNDGYPMHEVTTILDIVDQNRERPLEAWREHFDD